jgi:hypothetical protein
MRFAQFFFKRCRVLLVLGIPFLSACFFQNEPSENELSQQARLVERDLAALNEASDSDLPEFDQQHFGRFKQVFGGYSAVETRRFIDLRARYFIGQEDEIFLYPGHVPLKNLLGNRKFSEPYSKAITMASNVGIGLWFKSLMENQLLSFKFQGRKVPIDSGRVGLILLGSGYRETLQTKDGIQPLPPSFRHLTLIHESRHSDCTGGISRQDLAEIRLWGGEDPLARLPTKTCGHLHSRCPEGHSLQGLLACDDHPWGSYSIEALYAEARSNQDLPIREWVLLQTAAIDSRSRLTFNYTDLLKGALGEPDLSDLGVL